MWGGGLTFCPSSQNVNWQQQQQQKPAPQQQQQQQQPQAGQQPPYSQPQQYGGYAANNQPNNFSKPGYYNTINISENCDGGLRK